MKRMASCLVLMGLFAVGQQAEAMTIVDLVGDKDGFGMGILPDAAFPIFNAGTVGPSDGDGTDELISGGDTDFSYTHTYDLTGFGPISSASLEIMTIAQGFNELSNLLIDGVFVGTLTDGDIAGNPGGQNIARLDTFDLTPFIGQLDGDTTFTIDTPSGDGWAFDYSELTIIGGDATGAVPEPITATLGLMGLGVLSMATRRRVA